MGGFEEPIKKTNQALGEKLCKALLAKGFKTARYAEDAASAAELALALVPEKSSVGVPGTVTVRQLGLFEKLEAKGCTIYHHWDPSLTPEKKNQRLSDENTADWFITSANAMTNDGKIINIDGTGNRVAAMAWATGKLLFIVSLNKVARDTDSAIARARDSATPPNALRIGGKPPCTQAGHCVNCDSPERFCRVVTIQERVPLGREAHIILVGENLGY